VLGLGAGAVYALLAQGIVLTYRGSGILNFAQSAMAVVGAFVFWDLREQHDWALAPAMVVGVAAVTVLGALVYVLVMRPLAGSAALVRVISTLGILTVLTAAATLFWGGEQRIVPSSLPVNLWVVGDVTMTSDRIYLVLIAAGVTGLAWAVYRFTRFGLAVQAAAEDERGAAALGWSPDLLAIVNWAAGGALAGIAGILVVPLTGLQVDALTIILIAAMAAALLGGFSSFWLTLVGGLAIGIMQSEVTHYFAVQGAADAVPFLVIVGVLVIRGKGLPLRSHLLEHLPKLGPGRLPARMLAIPAVLAVLILTVFPADWNNALTTSLTVAIVLLSIVVLTGFAGQISLAQYALAGMGALVAGRLVESHGVPVEIALVAGAITAIPVGLVFALPALRTRGINLAVVTLGLGLAVQAVVLTNTDYTGGAQGTSVGSSKFFGINIDRLDHPERYAVFVLGWLVVLTLAVLNVRRGRAGRRLIAVRTNERAAASLGVNVFVAKLYAFALSAAIAGLGGTLLAFQDRVIVYAQFSVFGSINAVVLAVLGGVGYALGAVSGSVLAVGGVAALVTNHLGLDAEWLVLLGGVFLLVQLMIAPDGLASLPGRRRSRRSGGRDDGRVARPPLPDEPESHARVTPAELCVEDLSVTVGGVQALVNVSLNVRTGEVIGLIGPNGAGKTTLIDAATGFVRPTGGQILVDGTVVNRWSASRRARMGVSRSFQSLELFEDLSVRDNILAGADRVGMRPYLTDVFWPRRESFPTTAVRAIREFDLQDDLDKTPGELPYGRRRLVSIARALAAEPSILLLDEPAAGLSDVETTELSGLLRRLVDEWGVGILLVEHDMNLVMTVCDRVVALDMGEVIGSGPPSDIRSNERVRGAYLGDAPPHPNESAAVDAVRRGSDSPTQ